MEPPSISRYASTGNAAALTVAGAAATQHNNNQTATPIADTILWFITSACMSFLLGPERYSFGASSGVTPYASGSFTAPEREWHVRVPAAIQSDWTLPAGA
jgi:hypothetical protein